MHRFDSFTQIQHKIAEDTETLRIETQAIDSSCLRINHCNHLLIIGSEGNAPKSRFRNEASVNLS